MKTDKIINSILSELALNLIDAKNYDENKLFRKQAHDKIVKHFVNQTKDIKKELRECRSILRNPDKLSDYISGI